ncbi:MAG: CAF17-like 4Fe-4S cluster assembly/insertion protein YgfZ [Phycisphaerales bacterium]
MHQPPLQSPLHALHTQQEASFLPYGSKDLTIEVVESFGDLDLEYASIRKGSVIFDTPHMGTLKVTGQDHASFLNNMLTNKVDDLKAGTGIRSFWLNLKGRIEADIRIAQHKDHMLLALDRHLCECTATTLESFIFAEDVEIRNISDESHRLSIHGPTSTNLLAQASDDQESTFTKLQGLNELDHTQITIESIAVDVQRDDLTGETGYELCLPRDGLKAVYTRLLEITHSDPSLKARPTGWLAINAARIEAGRPLYHIDFTDANLPIESGVFDSRVSLTKGCYLGQEIVARMHARNACTKQVVAIKLDEERITTEHPDIHQPTGGSQIFEIGKEGQTPIGTVTSSTISPMLGAVPICFAMIKANFVKPGTVLSVSAEGKLAPCTVQDSLVFWSKP